MKPVGIDQNGKVQFVPNLERKDYIVWDEDQESPKGFGVRVARKKTFVVRRKIEGKAISPTVGDVADYLGEKSPLTKARADAASLVLKMRETKSNPNAEARKRSAAEMTVGEAIAAYRNQATNNPTNPHAAESLKTYDVDARKFDAFGWSKRKICEMDPDEIQAKFIEELKRAPAAAERAFSFVISAVNWCIEQEKFKANLAKRAPLLDTNPFRILRVNKLFRSHEQKEAQRERSGTRNPLSPTKTLGRFLEVCWSKRRMNNNETGVDFLITQLLLGCRKSEHADAQWGELLTPEERLVTTHVILDDDETWGPYIYIYWSKNKKSHRLPLGPMMVTLLRRRQEACADDEMLGRNSGWMRQFVFPAQSKFCKTGHYSSPGELLGSIRDEAGLGKLVTHDLRRSFGTMLATLDISERVARRFLNHAHPDVTSLYTASEWARLRTLVEKIEGEIFMRAPNVYNSLKPANWPMLDAPEPHVCKRVQRTGRPRKHVAPGQVQLAA